ncbi:MAG: hypothetical protein MJ016_00115 [Victivallaceae bacterium]|nr:hypothetical protein [Victivallaceae bacterium]
MNVSALWKKFIAESPLDENERQAWLQRDPDAMSREIAELRRKLDAAENAQLSETEKMQKALDGALAEREEIEKKYRALERRNKIDRIARDAGCADADYLDFLAGKRAVDLDDEAAVAAMIGDLTKSHPSAFFSRLQSGGGSGCAETLERDDGECAFPDPVSRIGALMQTIGKVPFKE